MRAIGKWVFVLRDEKESTFGDLNISEKALTKNYVGEIKHIANDKIVTFGDRVHLPHYGVTDNVADGIEYAVFDSEKLFAKQVGKDWVPINGYVKVRKCVNDHIRDSSGEVALYMTDNHIEKTNWVEIIDVADDCKHMRKEWIGYFCFSPERSEKLQRILYSKEFMLHESEIKFITSGE